MKSNFSLLSIALIFLLSCNLFSQTNSKLLIASNEAIYQIDDNGSNPKKLFSRNEIIDIADSEEMIYFSDVENKSIFELKKLDKTYRKLNISVESPSGLFYVASTKELYYADKIKKTINKYNTVTAKSTLVLSNLGDVQEIWVDISNDRIFWSEFATRKIFKSSLNGDNKTVIQENVFNLFQLEYNSNEDALYYYENGNANTNTGIRKINSDGTNYTNIISDLSRGFSADFANSTLYFVEYFGKLKALNLDGSLKNELQTYGNVDGIYFSQFSKQLYYKSSKKESLLTSINLSTNSSLVIKYNDLFYPSGMHVDSASQILYYVNQGEGFNNVKQGNIGKYDFKSGLTSLVLKSTNFMGYPMDIYVNNNIIYYTDANYGSLFTCNLNGENPVELVKDDFSRPISLDIDPISKKIYVFDQSEVRVFEYNFNGTNTYESDYLDWFSPQEMIYSRSNNTYYWSETQSKSIKSFVKNNSQSQLFYQHNVAVYYMAFFNDFIYFTDANRKLFKLDIKSPQSTLLEIADIPSITNSSISLERLAFFQMSEIVDNDGDGFNSNEDCDDSNANINSNATEICNHLDDDCDNDVDEGTLLVYFEDADQDGFGNPVSDSLDCSNPGNYVNNATDCDDSNTNINSNATEICNHLDDDCDNDIDEGTLLVYYEDTDQDGFGNLVSDTLDCSQPDNYVINSTDCNDTDATINPNAVEILGNGIDEDCDGLLTSIEFLSNNNKITLYPNPSRGIIYIKPEIKESYNVEILSLQNKLVMSFTNLNQDYIDLSNLKNGVYIVKFNDKVKVKIFSVVLIH